ncbi:DUF411 domain-containing protein [Campylobacter troglodytis]|uniref:DUF411 domain-containing protein n=1 Tax=Campylobacter troglodytis TaxID=654363 RepID=UPI001159AFB8|nr:DUF411 domain-containing protein [Campylobacter troglodytis]TQR60348.1 DUF411 domain-containing protein [Campylobacter troglodytis]
MKKLLLLFATSSLIFAKSTIELHQSPFCGCCGRWAKYMQDQGYTVKIHKSSEFYKLKEELDIKTQYQSCHTALVEGYAIEGHVPESAISWLLKERPKDVIGISTPGMPIGSPGMEQGDVQEEYAVIIMLKDGSYKVYGIYRGDVLIKKG